MESDWYSHESFRVTADIMFHAVLGDNDAQRGCCWAVGRHRGANIASGGSDTRAYHPAAGGHRIADCRVGAAHPRSASAATPRGRPLTTSPLHTNCGIVTLIYQLHPSAHHPLSWSGSGAQLVCIEGTIDLAGVVSMQAVYALLTAHERSADIFRAIKDVERTDCDDGSILLNQVGASVSLMCCASSPPVPLI
jgi:hypothetical protein